jgi:hypothetical protein
MVVRRGTPQVAPRPESKPALLLTGGRRSNRYIIGLHGKAVPLTYTYYNVFADLLAAQRDPKSSGFASSKTYPMITRVAICRLRRLIDKVLGDGAGKDLILTGSGEEYRLNLTPEQIALDPSLAELVNLKIISPEQFADLQARFETLPERWNPSANGDSKPALPATIRMTRPRLADNEPFSAAL